MLKYLFIIASYQGMTFTFRQITLKALTSQKYVRKLLTFNKADVYSGEGIRKMKAYISDIPEEQIYKKREEYWGTRIEGDLEIWNTLKMCCDEATSDGKYNYINILPNTLFKNYS